MLEKTIKEKLEKIRKKELREKKAEERYKRKMVRQWALKEDKFIEAKLSMAKKIFKKLNEFREKYYNKLMKLMAKGVEIMAYGWAHKGVEDHYGCWSRLYLDKDCLVYGAGYKWMYPIKRIYIKTPEDLAKEFTKKYIEDLLKRAMNIEEYISKEIRKN